MIEWIEKVWKPVADKFTMTYLIIDEFSVHMTTKVKKALADCNTEVDYIPGGYTSKLQCMDVGINKPFKNYIRNSFEDWLVANSDAKPTCRDVDKWIWDSWNDIKQETIKKSWKRCGFKEDTEVTDIEVTDNDESESDDDDPLFLVDVE